MFLKYRIYFIFITFLETVDFGCSYIKQNGRRQNKANVESDEQSNVEKYILYNKPLKDKQCWLRVNSKKHFEVMDKLDERYTEIRKEYQDAADKDNFDKQMLEVMLKSRGVAEREIQNAGGDAGEIPAGINLGGYFMMRMPNSLLFFHRMKLRNNTHFRVTNLRNDLMNLTLHARLSLNDLHLVGSYDRSNTDTDPSILFYTPTYGQIEFLLKNVQYRFEGRYRLLKDRLTIEMIISDLDFDDVLLTYLNNPNNEGMRLQKKNIDEFLIRLKADLDKWLKDYFNDYLMYFGLVGQNNNHKFQQYDKERAKELNNYMDHVIDLVTKKVYKIKAETVKLPKFTIFTANNMELLLKDGTLRGFDSIYRRSIATGKKEGNIRRVDAVIGFSNLKVIYQYEALLAADTPVLSGMIILTADELTARMSLAVAQDTESVDIQFEYLEQAKPESLTIEGAANRMISNFKYLLEQHVIAIMTNTLYYNIQMLGSITRCVPLLNGQQDPSDVNLEEEVTNSDTGNEFQSSTPGDQESVIESTTAKNSEVTSPADDNGEESSEQRSDLQEVGSESEEVNTDKEANNDDVTTKLVINTFRKRIN